MQTQQFLPSSTRGYTDIGWLKGFHSFNFGAFYEPTRLPFGPLVILNDDTVQPGTGFGTHRHTNMEIISIPLEGAVTHKDSTGTETVIAAGDVQVMSAGTGISHSEYNSGAQAGSFLQIWIQPRRDNVAPRYQQLSYGAEIEHQFRQILSPNQHDEGLWIHQSAWMHLGKFTPGTRTVYKLKQEGNGIYIFLINGEALVNKQLLLSRDALTISNVEEVTFNIIVPSLVLIIEVAL